MISFPLLEGTNRGPELSFKELRCDPVLTVGLVLAGIAFLLHQRTVPGIADLHGRLPGSVARSSRIIVREQTGCSSRYEMLGLPGPIRIAPTFRVAVDRVSLCAMKCVFALLFGGIRVHGHPQRMPDSCIVAQV